MAGVTFSVTFKKENGRELCVWLTNSLSQNIKTLYSSAHVFTPIFFNELGGYIDFRGTGYSGGARHMEHVSISLVILGDMFQYFPEK